MDVERRNAGRELHMNRKKIGFVLFVCTSYAFLGTAILRQDQIIYSIVAVLVIILSSFGLRDHLKELKG